MSAIAVSGPSSVCKASHTAESTAWSHSFVSVQSDATQMSASYRVLVDLSPKAKHPSASSGSCSKGASHACSKGVSPTGSPTGLWSYLSSPPASAPKATSLREASPLSLPTPALLKPPALSTGAAMGSGWRWRERLPPQPVTFPSCGPHAVECWGQLVPAHKSQLTAFQEFGELVAE